MILRRVRVGRRPRRRRSSRSRCRQARNGSESGSKNSPPNRCERRRGKVRCRHRLSSGSWFTRPSKRIIEARGNPWWTAGATKGHVINLLPVASLRNQHLLERTLRHEVAHVVIGTRLDGRPRWVQEAAAMFLAGELDVVAESAHDAKPLSGAGCPADAEWVAGSRDSMDRAYRRAAECFRSALAAGRRWDGIGTGGER